ncbi:metallophosphoesterase [Rhodococcus ruber]|uniref:metallophosphoesterase family protein n=1 Tax=Rhodococcus ruber TaxID=1830 RepID=UPI0017806B5B|nr:metallophosphoesterase family protein [Rhodococcus ruber]MBD8056928.1 metallophosphoesterase [Rhodococcus ruber]
MTGNTWMTSDLHLGHRFVAELRGFATVDEHDAEIIGNLRARTRSCDQLWILGDISSGSSTGERHALKLLDEYAAARGVTMHLITGNHDSVNPYHRDSHKHFRAFTDVFTTVQPFARRKVAGTYVWLSHFPWFGGGDRGDVERHSEARLHDNGRDFLVHGHLHGAYGRWTGERSIDVGLDNTGLRPLNWSHLVEMISKRAEELRND